MEEFVVYQSFSNQEEAEDLVDLLKENSIAYKVESSSGAFNPSFVFTPEISVLVKSENIELVDDLFISQAPKDYYLFDFSDLELQEVIEKKDEWSLFDYQFAQKILLERGIVVNEAEIKSLNSKRISELSQPEESQKNWIILGYALILVGALPGIFIGYSIWKGTKTLPNGEYVHRFSEGDREHGKWITWISIALFIPIFLWKLWGNIQQQMN
jgi:hypothetical protein